ncbi:hypothetical protein ACFFX0_20840 [Citricoccus parietis]|uniref:Uncharacterized protein n=1 Tax=Citricoccus parietis TaxID=592307 RepID=A0ABV5G3J8_9MICC
MDLTVGEARGVVGDEDLVTALRHLVFERLEHGGFAPEALGIETVDLLLGIAVTHCRECHQVPFRAISLVLLRPCPRPRL